LICEKPQNYTNAITKLKPQHKETRSVEHKIKDQNIKSKTSTWRRAQNLDV